MVNGAPHGISAHLLPMGGCVQATVLGQGGISMGRRLVRKFRFQGGSLLGWAARNGFGGDVSGFAALLEVALDGGERDLEGGSNLGLAMALVHRVHNPLA
jgi:hypothetical protein